MRLLLIEVPAGLGQDIARTADKLGADRVTQLVVTDGDAVLVRASNEVSGTVLDAVGAVPGASATLIPHEAMLFTDDDRDGRRQLAETDPRSAVEVYARGMKAAGSWSSFLLYALVAGVLAWVALWQSSVFVMVAAVLVAPHPSAAVNTALATACGDRRLLGRGVVRYAVAVGVGVLAAFALSVAADMDLATDLMRDVSFVSGTAVLLPIAGGIAAALYLSQSEQSSLISAAAAGVLVAVALVPPIGVIGMAAAIGDWQMAVRAGFLVLLQIIGINAVAPLVLWAYRVRPGFAWIRRGSWPVAAMSLGATVVALGGMLAWQFLDTPSLERPTVAREVQELVVDVLDDRADVRYVSSDLRFAAARDDAPDLLLGTVYVQPLGGERNRPTAAQIRRLLQARIAEADVPVRPLLSVTVISSPPR